MSKKRKQFYVHNHVQTIKHCSADEACLVLLHGSECLLSQPAALHAASIPWNYMSYGYPITSVPELFVHSTFKHDVAMM